MKNQQVPSAFGRQCLSVLEGYKKRLGQEPAEYSLKSYCDEIGVEYHKVIDWTSRHGYYVRSIKSEVAGDSLSEVAGSCKTFVQFIPRQTRPSEGSASLKGVSIAFPDGVSLRLEECSCESAISLLETYERRRSAKEEGCSR